MISGTTGTEKRTEKQRRFLRLLSPVRQRLSAYARAMTRDRDEAEDLAAETILVAFESLEKLRNDDAFTGWLFTIATRLHNRTRRRRKFFGAFDRDRAEGIQDRGTAPDVSAEIRMLYEALEMLPENQREAVVLFEIADLTLEEIREIQGGSLSGVKSRVARGREKLAQILGVSRNGRAEERQSPDSEHGTRVDAARFVPLYPGTER